MPLNFSTVSQSTKSNGIKVLCYGPAGVGKTVLAATLGEGTILVSAESGVLSLQRKNLEKLFGPSDGTINYDLPVAEVKTVQDFQDIYLWLKQSHEAKYFHTIAIDSISEIAEVVLNNAKRSVKDPRMAYGDLLEKMESAVRDYRDLPGRNVYMAAKMEPMKDETTGIIKYGPAMPGSKLGPKLPYFFDEVFRLGVNKTAQGEQYRFLQTQLDIQFDAKDRSGMLDPIEPPHLGKIFSKILGV